MKSRLTGKTITLIFTILLAAGLNSSRSQNTWTQKTNFGGTARVGAVGFSIGSKGYFGTGYMYDGTDHYYNDLWEYDPATNAWTQKANFGGTARDYATGFSIGSKGYIGTGFMYDGSSHFYNDFWEYDPATNGWTQKANFGGIGRSYATGFSIGSKGYIGTGFNDLYIDANHKDFWEYDPNTNAWTQKTDFGGVARNAAAGFSIGSKGYIGTGADNSEKNDFWEYDPATNTWTQKANAGGTVRQVAAGFSIGNKGYIGTGWDGSNFKNDFWEYDSSIDTWTQKANFGGSARYFAIGFNIGSKGYIGMGYDGSNKNDFWEYTPVCTYTASPAKPGSISGPATNACGTGAYNYSCPTVTNATSYNWAAPLGATINSGQGTTSINVTMPAGFTNGKISANASNCFGASANRTLTVYGIPKKPGTIAGPASVCANQTNVHYSIVSVAGASSYNWVVPAGASITAGQGTTAISVNYGTNGGKVKARSSSSCGSSAYKTLTVSITCRESKNEMESFSIYPNPSDDVFKLQINSANSDEIAVSIKDVSGRTLQQFQHLSSNTLTFGKELPAGIYFVEVNLNSEKKVMKVVKE